MVLKGPTLAKARQAQTVTVAGVAVVVAAAAAELDNARIFRRRPARRPRQMMLRGIRATTITLILMRPQFSLPRTTPRQLPPPTLRPMEPRRTEVVAIAETVTTVVVDQTVEAAVTVRHGNPALLVDLPLKFRFTE
jgi:transposase